MQNTYYPPNQPRPRRSYEFGIALRNAIETWKSNARVAVLASGGSAISCSMRSWITKPSRPCRTRRRRHRVVAPGASAIGYLRDPQLVRHRGAVQHLEMEVFDYVPCYRSPAGTGCAMAFAQWV